MPWIRPGVDTPFGFRPYGEVLSIGEYYKDSSAAAVYPGDAVILETDGGVIPAAASSPNIIGVAASYSAASTEDTVLVYDHPDQLFIVQDDSDTTGMTRASEGANADMVVTTGDTTTLQSKHELDSSSVETTAGLAVKVMRLHPMETSYATTTAEQRKWIVKFNSHLWGGADKEAI